jgi:hypothetical protein
VLAAVACACCCRQLNEIWPTGGWGSLEYGTPTLPGQVCGHRMRTALLVVSVSLLGSVAISLSFCLTVSLSVDEQVVGGRWKPLHYWLRNSAFADVMVTCGGDGVCFIKCVRTCMRLVPCRTVPCRSPSVELSAYICNVACLPLSPGTTARRRCLLGP